MIGKLAPSSLRHPLLNYFSEFLSPHTLPLCLDIPRVVGVEVAAQVVYSTARLKPEPPRNSRFNPITNSDSGISEAMGGKVGSEARTMGTASLISASSSGSTPTHP
ncbi:MAG: hypothetical protein LC808_37835 [Actinobacteria bacterium]|nr:hypothetical protein [Actinomycetota bacterium]